MDNQSLIDKYIKGRLSPEETKAFDQLKSNDAGFRKEVSFYEDLAAVVKEDEKEKLKQVLSDHHKKMKVDKKKNNRRRIISISIGILLLLAAIIGYQLEKKQKSPTAIYASHFEPYPNTYRPITRNSIDNIQTRGFTAYENGEYVLAAEIFDEILNTNRVPEVIFYQAISYGAMGNYPLAIGKLENIKRFDTEYVDEAYWYLGLFYLKQVNYPQAIRNFQDFIEITDNESMKQDAIDILGRIM